jgi:hypothetical protein
VARHPSIGMTRYRFALVWLAANAAVAVAYLLIAAMSWTEPEVRDVPGASGGAPIIWGLTAVPLFLLATSGNLAVCAWAWRRHSMNGRWPAAPLAWLIPLVWVCAVVVDFAHH